MPASRCLAWWIIAIDLDAAGFEVDHEQDEIGERSRSR